MVKNSLLSTLLILIFSFSFSACSQTAESNSNQNESVIKSNSNFLFVGTYTKKEGHVDGKAEGIYLYDLDTNTGALTNQRTTKDVINPSYMTLSADGNFLYAVNEIGPDVDSNQANRSTYAHLFENDVSIKLVPGESLFLSNYTLSSKTFRLYNCYLYSV